MIKQFNTTGAVDSVDMRAKGHDDPENKWVIARVSTTDVDSQGDVLIPGGVDLTEFKRNPVIFFGHQQDQLPIGKAIGIKKRATDIVAKIVFNKRPDSLPDPVEWPPDTVHDLFHQNALNGFSIGAEVMPGGLRKAGQGDAARFGKGVQRVVTRWKLREISVVGIPSNPGAMAMAISKGMSTTGWTHRIMQAALAEWELDSDRRGRLRLTKHTRLRVS